MSLNTFFRYFGSKWSLAPRYPAPRHDTIIEPFAGSAGYAVRHHYRNVLLIERDAEVAALWRYLIGVSARELLALPDLAPHGKVSELDVHPDARRLISLNVQRATNERAPDGFNDWTRGDPNAWGPVLRARLASQVDKIRHWQIIEGDYTQAPDIEATWFVDPPYQRLGSKYRHGARDIDFAALGVWCRARRGQVIVCENEGADWLPFAPHIKSAAARRGRGRAEDGISREAIWTNDR